MAKKKPAKKETPKKSSKKTKKPNYWMISTIILAVVLLAVFITPTSTTVSAETAGQKVLDFAKAQGADATLISATGDSEDSLYEVILSIDGQEVPVFVTKDGKTLVPQPIPLTEETKTPSEPAASATPTPTNIPKSTKPVVEAFVMSHCPYGTQIEKGLLPVVEILGDKIDFEFKFVYYAMHPSAGEVEEQLNQYCIQKDQKSKFNNYLTCFLEAGNGAGCLDSTGIDKDDLETCTTAADAEFAITENLEDKSKWLNGRFPLFNIHKEDNEKYQVGGSPTLIINGAKAQAGRDSVSLLSAICGAFETAPEECNTVFEAGTPSPGFGFGTASASNNAAAGCGV